MPSPRSLPFAASVTQANNAPWYYFARFDVPSPGSTIRLTDSPSDLTLSIDGSSQLWSAADIVMGPLTQNGSDIMSVSWVQVANLDYTWTNWANSPGLRGVTVKVWRGWFNSSGTFQGAIQAFTGCIDDQQHGQYSRMTLKPFGYQWERDTPWVTLDQFDPVLATLMLDRTQAVVRNGVNSNPTSVTTPATTGDNGGGGTTTTTKPPVTNLPQVFKPHIGPH